MPTASLTTNPGPSESGTVVPIQFTTTNAAYSTIANGQVSITVPVIANETTSGQTGSIKAILWYTTTPYDGSGDLTGYQVATVQYNNVLEPGQGFTAGTFNEQFFSPPDGTYYATLALEEANGQTYVVEDHITFSGTAVVSNGFGGSSTSGGSSPPLSGNFLIFDTTANQSSASNGDPYSGPVANLQFQYINLTSDNINVTATVDNVFIHSGSGEDALQVHGGTNVLDGGTGSNFLVGGAGSDTFFVDDRAAAADIWSTVSGFHAGDAATIWGVTPQDFTLSWVDNQGAAGFTGLTLHATTTSKPTASLTLAGYTTADLQNGRLSVSFGNSNGSSYMYVHGTS